jgi:hypothetical protein
MKMEAVAMVRRGWPNEGALDRAETIKAGSTVSLGDWVAKQSDGTVDLSGASASNSVGLVIQGNGDSGSAANSGKAVVLWSGFIVDVSNYDTNPTYAPGAHVTAKNGKLTLATEPSGTGSTYVPGDPVVGTVLDVVSVSATETAHLTVLVK